MEQLLQQVPAGPMRAVVLTLVWVVGAWLVEVVICRGLALLASKTKSEVDDQVISALRRPIFLSVLFMGLLTALDAVQSAARPRAIAAAVIHTLTVIIWSVAALRVGGLLLGPLSRRASAGRLIQPSTLPIFNVALKVSVIGLAIYFVFLAWNIDVTAWLASAGIVGIALGFAAKDSLANLFAGIFILADAPYKVGDYIVLDDGLRGQVQHIGLRSTRVLTRDDIEVTVPNSVIGNSKIVNESGGPAVPHRVRVAVSVSYESDVDHVRRVLRSVVEGAPHLSSTREPQVRFRSFGGSGLDFELLVWIDDPAFRGLLLDELNTRVYKAFGAAGIEIPYSKHDVYIKQAPQASAS